MLRIHLLLLSISMINGCSSVCLIENLKGPDNIVVFSKTNGWESWGEENDQKLETCVEISRYNYSQGNIISDYIPSFEINSMPACLLKKVKLEAQEDKGLRARGMILK